jgi:hypothetical protein
VGLCGCGFAAPTFPPHLISMSVPEIMAQIVNSQIAHEAKSKKLIASLKIKKKNSEPAFLRFLNKLFFY